MASRRAWTIPEREVLLTAGLSERELDVLTKAALFLNDLDEPRRMLLGRKLLRELWPDPYDFVAHQHWISTKEPGVVTLLIPNIAQRKLIEAIDRCRAEGRPIRIIILKGRQLGYSTFIQSWQYEQCDRNANRRSMTISFDDQSTTEMFQKARMIHQSLWFPQRCRREQTRLLELENGSTFVTATAGKLSAGRSQTFHHLHCSETPMWPNAQEVLLSVLQAVHKHPETSVFIESTAKGAVGSFYEMWTAAEEGRNAYIPFFAPWFWNPEYSYPLSTPEAKRAFSAMLKPEDTAYMRRHELSLEQMAWRHWTIQDACEGNPMKFRQEYPATPDEAFLTSGSLAFNQDAVRRLQQQAQVPCWRGDIVLAQA